MASPRPIQIPDWEQPSTNVEICSGHLDKETIAVFYAGGEVSSAAIPSGITLSDQLIGELENADDGVVSNTVYNFGMPSALKTWIDHICAFRPYHRSRPKRSEDR